MTGNNKFPLFPLFLRDNKKLKITMARTTDYLTFMVDVTPYEHEGNNYNALNIIVAYRKGQGFVISWQPVQKTDMGYQTGPMPSRDPLVGGKGFVVKEASRNNAKMLETMKTALLLGAEGIKFFFDQRNYDGLKEFMGDVCNYGYTADVEKQLQETIAQYNAMREDYKEQAVKQKDMTPMMKQFYDLKEKHPTAILLFRCGDFYETYEQDACICAKELGITLTKSTETGVQMAGFPYHALDTYLPKLVRYCNQPESIMKRVAICDQLEPHTPTKKRGITELVSPGIAETTTENNNSKSSTTMAKKNMTQNESANVQNAQVNNQPISDEVKEEISAGNNLPQVKFSTYTTKRGDTAPQIIGFSGEDDPRWKANKDAGHKWVSASYRRDLNGNKVYILLFGVRYMDVAKALAGAYNTADADAWHRAEDACMAIYEQAQRDGKAKWEAKKAQWAEKKAEKAAQKAADEQAKKCYTKEDVAAMLADVLAGKDVPEDIKRLLAKAA